jgi:hypothetical protein
MRKPVYIDASESEYLSLALSLAGGDFATGQRQIPLEDAGVPLAISSFAEGQEEDFEL